ncbi:MULTISPECIES: RNA-binding cell elongation regulator Jag/EloR [unclassified Gemella]|uniref:RNA-binding cell elongation regulator Jag/EloR n=1 Tax=unclassified Gemella TaxID=2624949 RepID=UPI0010738488|nr:MULTISPECIES: RNA-binding cell elongation regulator Jag/EloR [unclassified Gemella]MBF0710393.1 Jag N-terminal domain-containing protein [Gemella sp. GL1.1]MBF0747158.1 Jag N-terminal domain-containing protein [Gemella sp. 19428wG2_WT2a]NYS27737.1 Jag N-terminal domain-containing protein [Gemella sp. GL1]TFU58161.1 KH domain-containing protein [Gemella sp. WT2a]
MRNYEYKANSVDDAIKEGLKELNLSEDKVKIEVLEAGSAGFFGLFKKEALVRLSPLANDYGQEEIIESSAKKVEVDEIEVKNSPEIKEDLAKEEIASQIEDNENLEEKDLEKTMGEKSQDFEETSQIIEESENQEKQEVVKKEDKIIKNQEAIVTYIRNIVHSMGFKTASIDFDLMASKIYLLKIKDVDNSSLLIGKRGNTLNSIQYLANNYAKKFTNNYFKIIVDCEDYRQNRKVTLEELALNMAKKSKKLGRPVELEPMISEERKIIHNALSNIKNVETLSEGKEPHRYLIITAW